MPLIFFRTVTLTCIVSASKRTPLFWGMVLLAVVVVGKIDTYKVLGVTREWCLIALFISIRNCLFIQISTPPKIPFLDAKPEPLHIHSSHTRSHVLFFPIPFPNIQYPTEIFSLSLCAHYLYCWAACFRSAAFSFAFELKHILEAIRISWYRLSNWFYSEPART